MKKIRFLIILCILVVTVVANAQQQVSINEARKTDTLKLSSDTLQTVSNFKHHSIYVELLGNSIYYSVNYDYLFKIYKDNIKLVVGAGIGYFPYTYLDADGSKRITIHKFYFTPEATFLFGKKSHYFETGLAFMTLIDHDKISTDFDFMPSGRIGYRYQPQKGGFLFRMAYTPILRFEWIGYCWFGISFGYIF